MILQFLRSFVVTGCAGVFVPAVTILAVVVFVGRTGGDVGFGGACSYAAFCGIQRWIG